MNYTDEEVNSGIAEFMGYQVQGSYLYDKEGAMFNRGKVYTESLDSQIAVKAKLNIDADLNERYYSDTFRQHNFFFVDSDGQSHSSYESELGEEVQKASAHALYEAILKLKEK